MGSYCAHVTAESRWRAHGCRSVNPRTRRTEPGRERHAVGNKHTRPPKNSLTYLSGHTQTMDGYGLSEDEIFSPCLLNFTWENSNEQVRASRLLLSALSHLIYSLKQCFSDISLRRGEFCVVNKHTLTCQQEWYCCLKWHPFPLYITLLYICLLHSGTGLLCFMLFFN